jgi:hypothetical protein
MTKLICSSKKHPIYRSERTFKIRENHVRKNNRGLSLRFPYEAMTSCNPPQLAPALGLQPNDAVVLVDYQLTGNASQKVVVNGIEFSVPVRVQNGQPYVPTAYPIGVKK